MRGKPSEILAGHTHGTRKPETGRWNRDGMDGMVWDGMVSRTADPFYLGG